MKDIKTFTSGRLPATSAASEQPLPVDQTDRRITVSHKIVKRTSRLAGHALEAEGRPRLKSGCCGTEGSDGMPNNYDRMGHGCCSCGAFSACESTDRARQQWHRDHKNQVRMLADIDVADEDD